MNQETNSILIRTGRSKRSSLNGIPRQAFVVISNTDTKFIQIYLKNISLINKLNVIGEKRFTLKFHNESQICLKAYQEKRAPSSEDKYNKRLITYILYDYEKKNPNCSRSNRFVPTCNAGGFEVNEKLRAWNPSHWTNADKQFFMIRIVFSDSNKLTLFITKVFGYRPGNNSSAFNVSTHEGAGTFQALANKELTSPKANWASGL
ncbi:hypothetical protein H8356DRAFT_1437987 [Neocallimastix lanati (nom. inval.)]|nr:hypothetical protein H8356DRAFT_1437987 [Neocallimastix sp. JGI-2020a]